MAGNLDEDCFHDALCDSGYQCVDQICQPIGHQRQLLADEEEDPRPAIPDHSYLGERRPRKANPGSQPEQPPAFAPRKAPAVSPKKAAAVDHEIPTTAFKQDVQKNLQTLKDILAKRTTDDFIDLQGLLKNVMHVPKDSVSGLNYFDLTNQHKTNSHMMREDDVQAFLGFWDERRDSFGTRQRRKWFNENLLDSLGY